MSGAVGRSGRKEIVEIDLTGSGDESDPPPPPATAAATAATAATTAVPAAVSTQWPVGPKRPRGGGAATAAPTPLRERQPANQGWQPANRGWACPTCTVFNAAASARCEMECGGVRPAARPQGGKQLLDVKPDAKLATQLQWPSTVKVSPLARLLRLFAARLRGAGSRRLDAWHGGEDRPLGAQPLPRVSSEPPPKVTDLTACDHPGGRRCVSCTFRNSKASSHCHACGTWRYHRPLP